MKEILESVARKLVDLIDPLQVVKLKTIDNFVYRNTKVYVWDSPYSTEKILENEVLEYNYCECTLSIEFVTVFKSDTIKIGEYVINVKSITVLNEDEVEVFKWQQL